LALVRIRAEEIATIQDEKIRYAPPRKAESFLNVVGS